MRSCFKLSCLFLLSFTIAASSYADPHGKTKDHIDCETRVMSWLPQVKPLLDAFSGTLFGEYLADRLSDHAAFQTCMRDRRFRARAAKDHVAYEHLQIGHHHQFADDGRVLRIDGHARLVVRAAHIADLVIGREDMAAMNPRLAKARVCLTAFKGRGGKLYLLMTAHETDDSRPIQHLFRVKRKNTGEYLLTTKADHFEGFPAFEYVDSAPLPIEDPTRSGPKPVGPVAIAFMYSERIYVAAVPSPVPPYDLLLFTSYNFTDWMHKPWCLPNDFAHWHRSLDSPSDVMRNNLLFVCSASPSLCPSMYLSTKGELLLVVPQSAPAHPRLAVDDPSAPQGTSVFQIEGIVESSNTGCAHGRWVSPVASRERRHGAKQTAHPFLDSPPKSPGEARFLFPEEDLNGVDVIERCSHGGRESFSVDCSSAFSSVKKWSSSAFFDCAHRLGVDGHVKQGDADDVRQSVLKLFSCLPEAANGFPAECAHELADIILCSPQKAAAYPRGGKISRVVAGPNDPRYIAALLSPSKLTNTGNASTSKGHGIELAIASDGLWFSDGGLVKIPVGGRDDEGAPTAYISDAQSVSEFVPFGGGHNGLFYSTPEGLKAALWESGRTFGLRAVSTDGIRVLTRSARCAEWIELQVEPAGCAGSDEGTRVLVEIVVAMNGVQEIPDEEAVVRAVEFGKDDVSSGSLKVSLHSVCAEEFVGKKIREKIALRVHAWCTTLYSFAFFDGHH